MVNGTSPALLAARRASAIVFLVNGTAIASWAVHIPTVKESLQLTEGLLGLALLAMAAGAVCTMPVAGRLIDRVNSRAVTRVAGVLFCLCLPLPILAPSLTWLIVALFALGASNGAMDVAMNAYGAEVEHAYRKSIMASLHALFSIGCVVGAAIGALSFWLGIGALVHMLGMAIVLLVILGATLPRLSALDQPAPEAHEAKAIRGRLSPILFGVGAIAMMGAVGEGSMADWSAVYLRHDLSTGPVFAAMGFGAFALAMTIGRLTGDRRIEARGRVKVMQRGALVAAIGLGTSLIVTDPLVTLVGFACVGFGLANLSPIAFIAATRYPNVAPGAGIALTTMMGYSGFLLGPPLIGFIAEFSSLRMGLGLVAVFAGAIVIMAPMLSFADAPKGQFRGEVVV